MAKGKKPRRSKAERDAWNAHVDETIRYARELVTKARAELAEKRAQPG